MFELGCKVQLIKAWGRHSIGDSATVVAKEYVLMNYTFIGIEWDTSLSKNKRDNGGYFPEQFERIYPRAGEQLLFVFMY